MFAKRWPFDRDDQIIIGRSEAANAVRKMILEGAAALATVVR